MYRQETMRHMEMQSNPKQQGIQGGGNIIINGVLAYFFYVYAFQNPDNNQCFASPLNNTPSAVA